MRVVKLPLLLLLWSCAWCRADQPFDHAHLVPQDVDVYLHVHDGAALRCQLGEHDIGQTLATVFAQWDLHEAWQDLAGAVGVKAEELFDHLLGQSTTLVMRRDPTGEMQWGVIATATNEVWAEFVRRARPIVHTGQGGIPQWRLPEQELFFARSGDLIIIGPDPNDGRSMFLDLVLCVAAPGNGVLADDEAMRTVNELGRGQVGLFLRHAPPLGGWSAGVLRMQQAGCSVAHHSHFESGPFGEATEPLQVGERLMARVADHHALVWTQPFGLPGDAFTTMVRARLEPGVVNQDMLNNLRERMFIVVDTTGEDGDTVGIGVAIEVDSTSDFAPDLDRVVCGTFDTISRMLEIDTPMTDLAGFSELAPHVPRSLSVGNVTRKFFPGLPLGESPELVWTSASGGEGEWWIIATDRSLANDLQGALAQDATPGKLLEVPGQRGRLRGRPASAVMRAITMRSHEHDTVEPQSIAGMEAVMKSLAALLENTSTIDWVAGFPSPDQMISQWIIRWHDK